MFSVRGKTRLVEVLLSAEKPVLKSVLSHSGARTNFPVSFFQDAGSALPACDPNSFLDQDDLPDKP